MAAVKKQAKAKPKRAPKKASPPAPAKQESNGELITAPDPADFDEERLITFVNESHMQLCDDQRQSLNLRKDIGDALLSMRERVEHGAWIPWVEAHCNFAKRQAQRYMEVAEKWDRIAERLQQSDGEASRVTLLEDVSLRGALDLLKEPKTTKSSTPQRPEDAPESEERYTPLDIVKDIRFTLGEIVLDPASSKKANEVVEAQTIFTREDDGLTKDWIGSVFLSPPKNLQGEFVEKCCSSFVSGSVKQYLILCDALTQTDWFHRAFNISNGVCFFQGPIDFLHDDGKEFPQEHGQAVFYAGREGERLDQAFAKHGFVIRWGG